MQKRKLPINSQVIIALCSLTLAFISFIIGYSYRAGTVSQRVDSLEDGFPKIEARILRIEEKVNETSEVVSGISVKLDILSKYIIIPDKAVASVPLR